MFYSFIQIGENRGKMMEWISVKDRLPDFEKRLVVAYGHCKNPVIQKRIAGPDEDFIELCEYTRQHGFLRGPFLFSATHWMPLPSPPKE